MVAGTVISQAIPVLISPVITSLYTTGQIGVFAVFTSLTMIVASVINGKYQLAMMLPKNTEDAISIFWICFSLALTLCLFLLAIIFSFNEPLAALVGNEEVRPWLYFLPLSAFIIAMWDVSSLYVSRSKLFRVNATSRIANAITYAVLSITSGAFFKSPMQAGYLIFSRMAAFAVAAFVLMRKEIFSVRLPQLIALMKKNAKQYSDFPKFLLVPSVLDAVSVQIPVLVVSKFYSLDDAGFYNLTMLVLNAPLAFIAAAYSQVFFQKISSYEDLSAGYSFFKRNVLTLFVINLVFLSIIFWKGVELFDFFYGKNWYMSGYYATILAPALLLKSVANPLSVIFSARNKVRIASIWLVTYFCTTILMFTISVYLNVELVLLIKIYTIHEIVLYALYLYLQFSLFSSKHK